MMGVKELVEEIQKKPIDEILIDLYIDKNMSIREVSEELKVSSGTVHKWLAIYNISKQTGIWKD